MEGIYTKLQKIIDFLTPHLDLANSHMVDYFTKDLWTTYVSIQLREEFCKISPPPLNIINYFKENFLSQNTELHQFLKQCFSFYPNITEDVILDFELFDRKISLMSKAKEVYLSTNNTFMSQKKEHEVILMSEIVSTLSKYKQSTHIVDVGDGRGYLSSHLAMQNGLKILGLDSCHVKTLSASKRSNKMQKHLIPLSERKGEFPKKNISQNEIESSSYKQMTKFISSETDLRNLLVQSFPGDKEYTFGIVGLHTCGSLSPVCLQLYVNNKHSNFLVNVGCCYHLLEEMAGTNENLSFPMSDFLRKKNFHLGRNARMLSLQAPDRLYAAGKIPDSLMFRAVFESLLVSKIGYCDNSEKQVGRIGSKCKNFEEYCRKGLMKLGLEFDFTSGILKEFFEKYKNQQSSLEYFYMLRVSIAPVIEHIILLDKLLYLHENGLKDSYILKLFDPATSPRCYAIISIKS